MSNTIKLKRGTSTPTTSNIASGEVAIDTSAQKLYINDSGTVKEIGGGGGVTSDAQYNTVAGTNAGDSFTGTDAEKNTLFGYDAGTAITSGGSNTVIGHIAGKSITNANESTFVGSRAGESANAWGNTGLGFRALYNSTTGVGNTALGYKALDENNSGAYNVAIGWQAVQSAYNDPKNYNIGVGYWAARASKANHTIAIGYKSFSAGEVTGENNIGIGYETGNAITSGADNTILGASAGDALTTGSNNLILGHDAAASAVGVSNEITLGDTNVTKFRVPGINFTVKDTTATEDYVLTVDANGEAGWEAAAGGSDSTKMPLAGGTFTGDTLYNDSVKAKFGTGTDLEIFHNGTDSWVKNITGKLRLCNTNGNGNEVKIGAREDQDSIIVKPLGATEIYHNGSLKFETTSAGISVTGTITASSNINIGDSDEFIAGDSNDLRLWHNGTDSYIKNFTGDLYIQGDGDDIHMRAADDVNIYTQTSDKAVVCVGDGAVELYYDNSKKFETKSSGVEIHGHLITGDNNEIQIGNSGDLKLYHDGSNSNIKSLTGWLNTYTASGLTIGNSDFSENVASFKVGNSCELYYDASKKFETISTGAKVLGRLDVDGDLISYSANNNSLGLTAHRWNDLFIANDIDILDNGKLLLGTGDDLQIYHDGTDSTILNNTGMLELRGNDIRLMNNAGNEHYVVGFANSYSALYYDNSKKIETTSTGILVSETVIKQQKSGEVSIQIGSTNAGGAAIYFDGDSNGDFVGGDYSWIRHTNGGDMEICADNPAADAGFYVKTKDGATNSIYCQGGGKVELMHNGSSKFETKSNGARVSSSADTELEVKSTGQDGAPSILFVSDNADDNADNWRLRADGGGTAFTIQNYADAAWETNIECNESGNVELYYDNSKKLETVSSGIRVNDWNLELKAPGDNEARLAIVGDNGDDNNDWSRITSYNGVYKWENMASGGWETNIECNGNENVELYYDNSKKFETSSTGATLIGRLLINNDTHGQYPVEVKNSNGNFIAGIYESSSADGRHGMFYLNENGGTNHVKLSTNGASYLTGGNVGIGTNSPDQTLHVHKGSAGSIDSSASAVVTIENSNTAVLQFLTPNNVGAQLRFGDPDDSGKGWIEYGHADDVLTFGANGPERMRVNSSGHFLVGTTALATSSTDPGFAVDPDGAIVCRRDGTMVMLKSIGTGGYTAISILSANTQVGSCTFNSGGTSWNTSSDYRLKENQVAISDGITRLKTLKPYRFNFKENPSETVDGFFAHEVSPAVPEAITGTKDAVATDDDAAEHDHLSVGDPIYQQIDQSKLVPLLTAALQEAIGRIEELETKVAALGG